MNLSLYWREGHPVYLVIWKWYSSLEHGQSLIIEKFESTCDVRWDCVMGLECINWTSCRISWWRNQMEIFFALLVIWGGNSPVTGEFPAQRPVTRSFEFFLGLHLNKRLSKWWGWWFETPSRPLWCQCNVETASAVAVRDLLCDCPEILYFKEWHTSPCDVLPSEVIMFVYAGVSSLVENHSCP